MDKFRGAVYILKTESQPVYKIGYSTKVSARMAAIKTGSPFFTIHKIYIADRKNEQHLHGLFDSKRVSGEWFLLDNKDLEFIDSYFFELYIKAGVRLVMGQYQERIIETISKKVGVLSTKTKVKTKIRKSLNIDTIDPELSEKEIEQFKKKGFSVNTCRYLKTILSGSPDMTAAELAFESGYSLSTAKHFKAIFNKLNP